MKRTPMELAGLASAAMPGLKIVGTRSLGEKTREFDSALLWDEEGTQWRVRSPRDARAAVKLETELEVLSGFTPAIRAKLPFRVPSISGAVQLGELRTFVYHQLPGTARTLEDITDLEPVGFDDLGRIVAAIHELPSSVVRVADLPEYTAEQFRSRRLNQLDQAALTGKVPDLLLKRWESAFENNELWTFDPVVVHGDFHEERILFDNRGRGVAVTGWTDLQIGDPALDFSWLTSSEDPTVAEKVVESYYRWRKETHQRAQSSAKPAGSVQDDKGQSVSEDPHLMQRAALHAEFALAQYLMSGANNHDDEVVEEAHAMLVELADDVERTGGQDVGQPKPKSASGGSTAAVELLDDDDDADDVDAVENAPEPEADTEPAAAPVAEADADPDTDAADDTEDEDDAEDEAGAPVVGLVPDEEEPAVEEPAEEEPEEEPAEEPAVPEADEDTDEESPVIVDDDYHPVFFRIARDSDGMTPVVATDSDDDDLELGEPTAPLSLDHITEIQEKLQQREQERENDSAPTDKESADAETDESSR